MTNRIFNFSAGPCTLPLEALEEAQRDFVDYKGTGMSLFEMTHRGKHYDEVHNQTLSLAREIYKAPEEFDILLLQGGATLQFSMIPMNLLGEGRKGGYVNSGAWAKKAIADAKKYGEIYTAWDGKDTNYARMPKANEIQIQENTSFLHITSNETIGGIRFAEFPSVTVPLVADMSSDFMSRYIPWDKFDLVYGGAQKNLGPAGLAVVYIRKSLLELSSDKLGAYLNFKVHSDGKSLYNTPPVFSIYMMGLTLKWIKNIGGLTEIERRAKEKADILYKAIDESDGYFNCPVNKDDRSLMNIVFRLPNEELEANFLDELKSNNLVGLKGHRSVGGCRASCYNAMPKQGVEKLVELMHSFKKKNSLSNVIAL
ncbi:3-phosphoserine/phosphohydroxythreonine transaminase [Thermoproteota archaeon]